MEKNENEKEQKNLFGDQDFVYNIINGHVLDIDDEIERLLRSKGKIDEKVKNLRKQKSKDLEALNIVGKEIKKLKPEEEKEEVKDAEIVDEEEEIKLEEDETEEKAEEKEESEPF